MTEVGGAGTARAEIQQHLCERLAGFLCSLCQGFAGERAGAEQQGIGAASAYHVAFQCLQQFVAARGQHLCVVGRWQRPFREQDGDGGEAGGVGIGIGG
ncbi:hypothetical protein [Thermomonas sp.]|uniref:hypothetical protein n=1 Tax=Thermomonas sp. TaxID=1971895 RepID=UPI0039E6913E